MDDYLAYHGLAAGGGQPVAHLKRQFVIAHTLVINASPNQHMLERLPNPVQRPTQTRRANGNGVPFSLVCGTGFPLARLHFTQKFIRRFT
jgi:hypothetical protein